ncbi:YlzJ-like family protein [Desulfothermobacter acidiphilus]|uniref:YlzJ-like family protein n=1 Tax=Desulfothermobacter acidiphilus TaxID=1938353 RepID=UPI003F8A3A48
MLYTLLPLELVWEEKQVPSRRLVSYKGVPVLVELTGPGEGRLVRVLSTDPRVFLIPELAPGRKVLVAGGE